MKLKDLVSPKYILYGLSIILTRGLELLVLFFAAHYLSKSAYGNLEFYKKVIEVGASFLAFGLPALLVSYTTNKQNKNYFYILSVLFILIIAVVISPVLYVIKLQILLVPLLFYAWFFIGSLTQNYILVRWNSNWVAIYKIIISILFYSLVYLLIRYYQISTFAYAYPSYVLFIPAFIFTVWLIFKEQIKLRLLRIYAKLFFKLLPSSLSLVVGNFANLMFLYTDIFIIKFLSNQPSIDIANYSFSLNVANILLIIPLTLVQVDIEKLKKSAKEVSILFKKILTLVIIGVLGLIIAYIFLIPKIFPKYTDTLWLFAIIITAKFFQALTPVFGMYLAVRRQYFLNLKINISVLLLNIILNLFFYNEFGLYGVAFASFISLLIRFVILKRIVRNKYINTIR